jgi:hypothetical protein
MLTIPVLLPVDSIKIPAVWALVFRSKHTQIPKPERNRQLRTSYRAAPGPRYRGRQLNPSMSVESPDCHKFSVRKNEAILTVVLVHIEIDLSKHLVKFLPPTRERMSLQRGAPFPRRFDVSRSTVRSIARDYDGGSK